MLGGLDGFAFVFAVVRGLPNEGAGTFLRHLMDDPVDDGNEYVHHLGVEVRSRLGHDHLDRSLVAEGLTIRSNGCNGVVDVGYGENSGRLGDVQPGEAVRLTGAVPLFVMVADDGKYRPREKDRVENGGADCRMLRDLLELFGRQRSRR